MSKDFFLIRYALIIQRLEKSPATFEQIQDYLLSSHQFKDAKIYTYTIRTLQRDIKDIERLFNISIKNKKGNGFCYTIEARPIMEIDEYNQRLLESYQIINAVNAYPDFANYVFFESRQLRGVSNFYDLLYAVKNRRVITFNHFNFGNQNHTNRKVHPLALKESKNRWYLIGIDQKDLKIKTFGLDRISEVEVLSGKFRKNKEMDLKANFTHSFGVISPEGKTPKKIVIRTTKSQGEYIKSYPLHTSQEITSEDDKQCMFQFYLHPTYDFMQEILSFGKEAVVLEPQSLIEDIRYHLQESMKNYS